MSDPSPDGAPVVDLLVRGGVVVCCDAADRVLWPGDIAVDAGVIVAVGPNLDVAARRVIDAAGDAVVPGFVNAHMHECMERGVFEDLPFMAWLNTYALPKDRAYEPRHQRAAALLCQAEMIRNGTTSFIDIFRHPAAAAEVAVTSGLRATISPQLIDDPEEGPGETLASSEAFVDGWRGRHPRVRPWFGPHSLYTVRESTYRRIRDLAVEHGVGIHTHLAESVDETTIVAERTGGLTPAVYLDRLIGLGRDVVAAHCIHLDAADLALVAERGVGVAHCPTSNMKLGNGMARVPELLAAGATVGLGTDSPMTNNDLDPFEEMRQAGLVAKLSRRDPSMLTSRELLRLATIGSATVLGIDDVVGSIEVGKRADLVVVDLDHPRAWPLLREHGANVVEQLVWACCGADVRFTICDGAVLLDDRRLTTLDLDEVAEVVDAEARHLLASAGVLDAVLHRHDPDHTENR